ncbi:MAG: hypothetical protein R2769_05370 [Saprospiraceae bacterium]
MKLFDLRFGETIMIFPQKDQSFHYLQMNESPDNYNSIDAFIKSVSNYHKVLKQLNISNI